MLLRKEFYLQREAMINGSQVQNPQRIMEREAKSLMLTAGTDRDYFTEKYFQASHQKLSCPSLGNELCRLSNFAQFCKNRQRCTPINSCSLERKNLQAVNHSSLGWGIVACPVIQALGRPVFEVDLRTRSPGEVISD